MLCELFTDRDVIAMIGGLAEADVVRYAKLDLDAVLLGFCMAKGMSAKDALRYVKDHPIDED